MKILLAALLAALLTPQFAYRVTRIQVTGAKRLSVEQVIALSGLKAPGTIEAKQLEDAKMRLANSGFFTQVSWTFRNAQRSTTVVISVEEPVWRMAVVFDNFVGVTDDQLKRAVAEQVPTFDGFIPDIPGAAERVQKSLEKLARDIGQPGTVSFMPTSDERFQVRGYRFHLDRASGPLPVCNIEVAGVPDTARDAIVSLARTLVGTDYSKNYVERYAPQSLVPALTRLGYVRAAVRSVEASIDAAPESSCRGRVRLAIDIASGPVYTWRTLSFSGNAVIESAPLAALLPFKAGGPVNAGAVDVALRAVEEAYRRKGYMRARAQAQPAYDDAALQVDYRVAISEGPQFHMGTLAVTGLDETLASAVKALWQLPSGDVYDASYAPRFIGEARTKLRPALNAYKPQFTIRQDPTALRVDVVVEFKNQ